MINKKISLVITVIMIATQSIPVLSEETVERIVFANSSEESEKREGNGSKKVLEKYKKLEESSSYDEFE